MRDFDTYPVGLLRSLLHTAGALRNGYWRAAYDHFRAIPAALLTRLRQRDWGGLRSWLAGYLAEPYDTSAITRAGHGWTRARAERDLERHRTVVFFLGHGLRRRDRPRLPLLFWATAAGGVCGYAGAVAGALAGQGAIAMLPAALAAACVTVAAGELAAYRYAREEWQVGLAISRRSPADSILQHREEVRRVDSDP